MNTQNVELLIEAFKQMVSDNADEVIDQLNAEVVDHINQQQQKVDDFIAVKAEEIATIFDPVMIRSKLLEQTRKEFEKKLELWQSSSSGSGSLSDHVALPTLPQDNTSTVKKASQDDDDADFDYPSEDYADDDDDDDDFLADIDVDVEVVENDAVVITPKPTKTSAKTPTKTSTKPSSKILADRLKERHK